MLLKQKPKPSRLLIALFVLLLCNYAFANPIIDPVSGMSAVMVTLSTIGLESAITTIALFCLGMSPVAVIFAMLFLNMFTFIFMVFGMLEVIHSVLIVELMIVTIEAAFIKFMARFDVFIWETFRGISWRAAFIVSTLGNIVSYFVGNVFAAKL